MPARIDQHQVEQFERDGYLLFRQPVFSDAAFIALKAFADSCYTEADGLDDGKPVQLIDCPHWVHPALFEWIFSDKLIGLVEPIIGPDIAVFASHFLRKPPRSGRRVPWHEDSAYWSKLLSPMEVATVIVGLEAANPENGCMRVIPGTHVHGYSDYEPVQDPDQSVFGEEVIPEQVDESRAVDLAIGPNEASLPHVKILHASNPNSSSTTRFAFAVRYFPTHVKFTNCLDKDFPVFLARGIDRAGNEYSDPEMTYPPRKNH